MTWTPYNLDTRKQIISAKEIAIKLSNGGVKTVTEKASMVHYIRYDCRTLVQAFQVLK